MMLARVADSLYWLGRYIERAEHTARVCDVMLTASLERSDSAQESAAIALAAIEALEGEAPATAEALFAVTTEIVFGRGESVVQALAAARENGRQVRDQLTTETWERLNLLYLRVTSDQARRDFNRAPNAFLHGVVADLHQFRGAADATMSHGEGWRFLNVGLHLERAQLIARLLDVGFGDGAASGPAGHLSQVSLLRMACALEPYLRVYTADVQPANILSFLLFDEDFPRSIRFCTEQLERRLRALDGGGRGHSARLAGRLASRLRYADRREVEEAGARPLLAAVGEECAAIHDAIHDTFVAYPLETRLPA